MRGTRKSRPSGLAPVVVPIAAGLLLSLGGSSLAQVPGLPGQTPSPTVTPAPTTAPTPSPTPAQATPKPSGAPLPDPPLDPGTTPSPDPGPNGSPKPGESPSGLPTDNPGDGLSGLIPPGFEMPALRRTPARNTIELVRILEQLTTVGVPFEEALSKGMGRVPVGGLAWWSDDWWNPRFTPTFHLHEGLDIFADFGTPVRAPDDGVITRVVDGPVGGLAVWMRARDGTQYYFAHLQSVSAGMEAGRTVSTGTVLGTVGDSGNARGGAPHLHFEIHAPNEVPPKPYVDAWLDEALQNAQRWVDARIGEIVAERKLLRTEQSLVGVLAADRGRPAATPEYSILLTLLDPVAGSVGLLPGIPLVPHGRPPPSERLISELVRLRFEGMLAPASADVTAYTDH